MATIAGKKAEKTTSNPLLLDAQGTVLRNILHEQQRVAALTTVPQSIESVNTKASTTNTIDYLPFPPSNMSTAQPASTKRKFQPPPKPKLSGNNLMPLGKKRKNGVALPGLPLAQPLLAAPLILPPQSLHDALAGFDAAARAAPATLDRDREVAGWMPGDPVYYEETPPETGDGMDESASVGLSTRAPHLTPLPDYLRLFHERTRGHTPPKNAQNRPQAGVPALPPPPPGASLPVRPDFAQGGVASLGGLAERKAGRQEAKGYFHPSFIEDPWAEFEARSFKHKLQT